MLSYFCRYRYACRQFIRLKRLFLHGAFSQSKKTAHTPVRIPFGIPLSSLFFIQQQRFFAADECVIKNIQSFFILHARCTTGSRNARRKSGMPVVWFSVFQCSTAFQRFFAENCIVYEEVRIFFSVCRRMYIKQFF